MRQKTHVSKGSYIIIKSIVRKKGTCKGTVIIKNIFKNIEVGDVVIYHLNDIKIIYIDGEEFHAIKYYDILFHEVYKRFKNNNNNPLAFQGLDASF
jgi:hypothetical protein